MALPSYLQDDTSVEGTPSYLQDPSAATQAPPPTAVPEVKSPGLGDYLSVGLRGLTKVPGAVVASAISSIQGQSGVEAPGQGDIFEENIVRPVAKGLRAFEQETAQKFPESTAIQTLSRLPAGIGFSLPSAATGIAAGLLTSPTEAVPGGQALPFMVGGATAGATAYRASSSDIMRSYIDTLDEEKRATSGVGLTPEETEAAKADFSSKATEVGLWEALPEAIGGAVAGRLIFSPLKKMVGERIAASMAGKIGGVFGEELLTETVTQIGQSKALAGTKLAGEGDPLEFTPSGALQALKEVAPDTLLLTAVMGGGMSAGQGLYRRRQENKLATQLGVNREELVKRVGDLLEAKQANPNIDVNSPAAMDFLAGAVTIDEEGFTQARPEVAPTEEGVTPETKKRPAKIFTRLEDTEDTVNYNIRGEDFAYKPPEGATVQDLKAGIAGKSDAAAVQWLKKNAEVVPKEEVGVRDDTIQPAGDQAAEQEGVTETPAAAARAIEDTEQLKTEATPEYLRQPTGEATVGQGVQDVPGAEVVAPVQAEAAPGSAERVTPQTVVEAMENANVAARIKSPQAAATSITEITKTSKTIADAVNHYVKKPLTTAKGLQKNMDKKIAAKAPQADILKVQAMIVKETNRATAAQDTLAALGSPEVDAALVDIFETGKAPTEVTMPPAVRSYETTDTEVQAAPGGVEKVTSKTIAAGLDDTIQESTKVTTPASVLSDLSSWTEKESRAASEAYAKKGFVEGNESTEILGDFNGFTLSLDHALGTQRVEHNASGTVVEMGMDSTGEQYYNVEGSWDGLKDAGFDPDTFTMDDGKLATFFSKARKGLSEKPEGGQLEAKTTPEAEAGKETAGQEAAGRKEIASPKLAGVYRDPGRAESDSIQKGIEKKSIAQATKFLIDNAPTPAYKAIATKVRTSIQRMHMAGIKSELHIAHKGDEVPSLLAKARGLSITTLRGTPKVDIWLNGSDITGKVGTSYEAALHEFAHAASQMAIYVGGRNIAKGSKLAKSVMDLAIVTEDITKHLNDRIAASKSGGTELTSFEKVLASGGVNVLETPHETLAWTLSNKDVQEYLDTIEVEGKTLWSKFVASFRKLLGLPVSANSALSKVLAAGETILDVSPSALLKALQASKKSTVKQTAAQQISEPEKIFNAVGGKLKAGSEKVSRAIGILSKPKDKLHQLFVQSAPAWLSVAPLHTLVQTFGKNISQIRDFSQHLSGVVASKTEIVDTSAVNHDAAETAAKKGVGVDTFNRAAATASFNRMTPWEGLLDQEWVPAEGTTEDRLKYAQKSWVKAGMQNATGMSFVKAHTEAAQAYKNLKTPELKEAYIKIVEHIGSIRTRERNNLLTHIESVSGEGSELRKDLMEQFNASFSDLYGAYWPLSRVGEYILEHVDADGFRTVEHFTNTSDRAARKNELLQSGIDQSTIKEDFKNLHPKGSVAIPPMLMGQLSSAVQAKTLEGVDQSSEEAVSLAEQRAQAIVDDMNQIWLRWQPETSALKNSVQRKNVKGFSTDMLRSYLDYMQRHASSIAWTEQGKEIENDIQSLNDDISAQKATGVDVTMQRHLLNDLRNRIHALQSVSVGPAASALGKLSTGYYMTSPSIALVQMSQLGVLTFPKLAVKYGMGKSVKALNRGVKNAFNRKFTRDAMFDDVEVNVVYENMRSVVTDENRNTPMAKGKALGDRLFSDEQVLKSIKKLIPYQQQLLTLREAMARNLLDISAAHEAYELTKGKDPKSLRSKIFNLALMPMSLSELASRKSTVLATLELSQNEGKNFFESMTDIAEVVDDTLYSYSKEAKGSAMQGGISRVVLQFQHYRIMTGLRLALLFNNAVRGESTAVKKAATKEFIGIMGMTGALAGTMGIPLSKTLFALLDAVLGDDDEPLDSQLVFTNWLQENLGKDAGDVAAYGLPTIAGMNLSRRIGLADIYGAQNEPPVGLHGRNLAAWWAASQLGPIFSVGQGWAQGYDEIVNKGNYMKGLEVATPKPIRDSLKALRVATEGLKTSQGKKLLADEDIGADEVLMIALGFNADEVAKAYSAERSLQKISAQISSRRGKLVRNAARAIAESDDTERVLQDIRTFNRKMPQYAISGSDVRPAVRKIIKGELGATGRRERLVASQYEIPVFTP